MVMSRAYLRFPGLGLEESGSSSKTHPHVVNGGIVCERAQRTQFFELNLKRWE
jgi:hypothetical protein